jgi:hypothetical protein
MFSFEITNTWNSPISGIVKTPLWNDQKNLEVGEKRTLRLDENELIKNLKYLEQDSEKGMFSVEITPGHDSEELKFLKKLKSPLFKNLEIEENNDSGYLKFYNLSGFFEFDPELNITKIIYLCEKIKKDFCSDCNLNFNITTLEGTIQNISIDKIESIFLENKSKINYIQITFTDKITLRISLIFQFINENVGPNGNYSINLNDNIKNKQIKELIFYELNLQELKNLLAKFNIKPQFNKKPYVNSQRILELKSIEKTGPFDLCKLIRFCEELNLAHENDSFYQLQC